MRENYTVFTFGFGHECVCGRALGSCYTIVEPTDEQTSRERMFARWGRKWAFDYPTTEAAGVDTWGMQLVPTNFSDLTRCPCGDALIPGVDANGSEVQP